eukprot:jgi/Ulvmu1/9573/UM054_0003.1
MLHVSGLSDELVRTACAALYHNVTEDNRQRICNQLPPKFIGGYTGDPTVEAAFTAFLRHPYSRLSDADHARSIGRKAFFNVALQNMPAYALHKMRLRRKLSWATSSDSQVEICMKPTAGAHMKPVGVAEPTARPALQALPPFARLPGQFSALRTDSDRPTCCSEVAAFTRFDE